MPVSHTATEVHGAFGSEHDREHAGGVTHDIDRKIRQIRDGLSENMRVYVEETSLLSESEARQQVQYVERSLREGKNIEDLWQSYASPEAHRRRQEKRTLYYSAFIQPLDAALEAHVISVKSYDEWLGWIRDPQRKAPEKGVSIKDVLPTYLKERWALAAERAKVLRDLRSEKVTDSKLKAEISFLRDDREYFDKHSYSQRKNLVDRVRAGLAVMEGGEEHRKLRTKAEAMLLEATQAPQPALHRDKVGTWLKRIFESNAKPEEIRAFLEESGGSSLRTLIETWRGIAVQFWTLRKDPAFQGVKTQWINTKAFLWLHYDERVAYVGRMGMQIQRAKALRARASELIAHATNAGALDATGNQRWLTQYVFNGSYTLEELESIIGGNLTERLERKIAIVQRFERASGEAHTLKGIRGMPLLEKNAFLRLHYEKQHATVLEMEMRIGQMKRQKPDFLLIRHFMDREDWDSALELIEEARQKEGLSLQHDRELTSMEHYIALHRKEVGCEHRRVETGAPEAEQLDELIGSITSPSLQRLCMLLCNRGSESIGALGWTSYNRDWCNKRGYLTPEKEHGAIRRGKAEALAKTRRTKRGVVNETIQGQTGEQEFIELSRSAPTNVCVDILDSGAVNAFSETLYRKRKDHRALYWTNAIFHRAGMLMDLQEQNEETRRMYKMRNLLRKVEAKGQRYTYGNATQTASHAKSQTFHSRGNATQSVRTASRESHRTSFSGSVGSFS